MWMWEEIETDGAIWCWSLSSLREGIRVNAMCTHRHDLWGEKGSNSQNCMLCLLSNYIPSLLKPSFVALDSERISVMVALDLASSFEYSNTRLIKMFQSFVRLSVDALSSSIFLNSWWNYKCEYKTTYFRMGRGIIIASLFFHLPNNDKSPTQCLQMDNLH